MRVFPQRSAAALVFLAGSNPAHERRAKEYLIMLSLTPFSIVAPAAILLESWREFFDRIWHYLNDQHKIGSIPFQFTALVEGAFILALAVLASRALSALLQRRIAKKAYLDPGLRYTMGRLTQYLIIALGVLLALKVAFSVESPRKRTWIRDCATRWAG